MLLQPPSHVRVSSGIFWLIPALGFSSLSTATCPHHHPALQFSSAGSDGAIHHSALPVALAGQKKLVPKLLKLIPADKKSTGQLQEGLRHLETHFRMVRETFLDQ